MASERMTADEARGLLAGMTPGTLSVERVVGTRRLAVPQGNAAAFASVKRALEAVIAADAAIAKARRDGVLHGLTIAREHAVAVIDGGTGEPAIDWTDVTVATGDALTAEAAR